MSMISDFRKAYIDVLHKHTRLYHFDDDIRDMSWYGGKPPTKKELEVMEALTKSLYSDELFRLAVKKINSSWPKSANPYRVKLIQTEQRSHFFKLYRNRMHVLQHGA